MQQRKMASSRRPDAVLKRGGDRKFIGVKNSASCKEICPSERGTEFLIGGLSNLQRPEEKGITQYEMGEDKGEDFQTE